MGIGKALIAEILKAAGRIGYDELKLDTLPHLSTAIALYRAAGFAPIAPYGSFPYPGLVCLGKDVAKRGKIIAGNIAQAFQRTVPSLRQKMPRGASPRRRACAGTCCAFSDWALAWPW